MLRRLLATILISLIYLTGCSPSYVRKVHPPPPKPKVIELKKAVNPKDYLFEVQWRLLDVLAIEQSKKEKKTVILFIFKPDCEECTQMFAHTFRNPDVMMEINENYIPCVLNAEHNQELAKFLMDNQDIFPMTIIVPYTDAFRIEIHGYITPVELIKFLRDFSKKMKSNPKPLKAPPPAYGNKVVTYI